MYDNDGTAIHQTMALAKIILSLEISDVDRRFHEDIMREAGKWWLDPAAEPLPFMSLWMMLEQRTKDVSTIS